MRSTTLSEPQHSAYRRGVDLEERAYDTEMTKAAHEKFPGSPSQAAARRDTSGYTGPTYYAESPVKPSKYGALVWTYTYVAGLSGSAQILATIAQLSRKPRWEGVVRVGRYLATFGSMLGGVLLIADLHTPKRWYNMLRIFRKTSPMSIGTYTLLNFGIASAIAAAAQPFGKLPGFRWLKRAEPYAQARAAISGAGMSTYTAALLSSTSTPVWSAAPRLLGARFACSSMATAAAALSLCEHMRGARRNSEVLDKLACTATLADAVLSMAQEKAFAQKGVSDAIEGRHATAVEHRLSTTLEHAVPLLCYGMKDLMPRHARSLSVAGAVGVLAGGLLMRATIFHAGNRSATRAQDYFALTQAKGGAAGQRTR